MSPTKQKSRAMKPDTPLVTMREDERVCFDRAMDQWLASIKRLDLSEKDRVKGALLAYQRQAFVFHEEALLEAYRRGRREGMEEAAGVAHEELERTRVYHPEVALGAKFSRDAIRAKGQ